MKVNRFFLHVFFVCLCAAHALRAEDEGVPLELRPLIPLAIAAFNDVIVPHPVFGERKYSRPTSFDKVAEANQRLGDHFVVQSNTLEVALLSDTPSVPDADGVWTLDLFAQAGLKLKDPSQARKYYELRRRTADTGGVLVGVKFRVKLTPPTPEFKPKYELLQADENKPKYQNPHTYHGEIHELGTMGRNHFVLFTGVRELPWPYVHHDSHRILLFYPEVNVRGFSLIPGHLVAHPVMGEDGIMARIKLSLGKRSFLNPTVELQSLRCRGRLKQIAS